MKRLALLFTLFTGSSSANLIASPIQWVQAGINHTCALLPDETLKCWGLNETGELGQGNTETRGDDPGETGRSLKAIDLGKNPKKIVQVVPGSGYTCVLFENQQVKCFGTNTTGQLGTKQKVSSIGAHPGEMGNRLSHVFYKSYWAGRRKLLNVTRLTSFGDRTCAQIKKDILRCWGGPKKNPRYDPDPKIYLGVPEEIVEFKASPSHACVVFESGRMKCWGINDSGQLGINSTKSIDTPDTPAQGRAIPFVHLEGLPRVKKITLGANHTCALFEDENVRCWGEGNLGQTGRGDALKIGIRADDLPTRLRTVDFGLEEKVKDLVSGLDHTCALFASGKVKCFGSNSTFALGIGNENPSLGTQPGDIAATPPVDVHTGYGVSQISAGAAHNCAVITLLGEVKCWGSNTFGMLGIGDTLNRGSRPSEMGSGLPFVDLRNP